MSGPVGHFVAVSVTDDSGTDYAASGQGSGGANVGTSRHEVRFAPAPPMDARVLAIHVASFLNPFVGPGVSVDGPWEFRLDLDQRILVGRSAIASRTRGATVLRLTVDAGD